MKLNREPSAVSYVSTAWLLSAWRRRMSTLTGEEVAARINNTGIRNWESNADRPPPLSEVQKLDALFGAEGTLVDLFQAVRTPEALPARKIWAHNFTWEDTSVWAWVRPEDPDTPVRVSLRWGAFKAEWAGRIDQSGIVFSSPVAIANPAVWIELDAPGWVDFGRGVVPEALGVPVTDVLRDPRFLKEKQHLYLFVNGATRLMALLDRSPPALQKTIDAAKARLLQMASSSDAWDDYVELSGAPEDAESQPATAISLATLRDARGLSRSKASDAATQLLPENPLSEKQVEKMEKNETVRAELPLARLDTVYRADGALGYEEIGNFATRADGDQQIIFPKFWIGPVWVAFDLPEGLLEQAVLIWGPWQKRLGLTGPAVVSCRKATRDDPPLTVRLPAAVPMRAGVGSHPLAHDVNDDWAPSSEGALEELFHMYREANFRMKGVTDRLLGVSGGSVD